MIPMNIDLDGNPYYQSMVEPDGSFPDHEIMGHIIVDSKSLRSSNSASPKFQSRSQHRSQSITVHQSAPKPNELKLTPTLSADQNVNLDFHRIPPRPPMMESMLKMASSRRSTTGQVTVRNRRRSSGHKLKKNRSFGPSFPINAVLNDTESPMSFGSSIGSDSGSVSSVITEWLKAHRLWFGGGIGRKLMTAMMESGIERPDEDLVVLSEYPDLHQIAAMASLNLLQRRQFIDAAHWRVKGGAHGHRGGDEMEHHGDGRKVVVMSAEEQVFVFCPFCTL